MEDGGIHEDSSGDRSGILPDIPELHDDMVFSLKPAEREMKEQKDDDPMWASASSALTDWFYADE